MKKLAAIARLPLGSWFRYQGGSQIYVLLDRSNRGVVAHANVDNLDEWVFQGMYSGADTAHEFHSMLVEPVTIKEAP